MSAMIPFLIETVANASQAFGTKLVQLIDELIELPLMSLYRRVLPLHSRHGRPGVNQQSGRGPVRIGQPARYGRVADVPRGEQATASGRYTRLSKIIP